MAEKDDVQAQADEEPQQSGWGSWFSSVAAKAADIYTTTVAPTLEPALTTVSQTTGKIVSDLTDIIDVGDDEDVSPIVEKRKPSTEGEKQPNSNSGPVEESSPSTDAPQEPKQAPQPPAEVKSGGSDSDDEDEFTKVLDLGVSAVQNSAQSLYGFFARGIESVQQTGVTHLAAQGLEKSKQVIASGVRVGQDVADKSLEALEKVGEKAMEVFATVDERAAAEAATSASGSNDSRPVSSSSAQKPAGAPGKRPAVGVVTGDTPRKKAKELTYESAFEEKLGAAAIQSLENLSIESMMKTQQMYRKFDADKRELVDEQFAALQEIFNIPRQEGAKISLPSTKISDKVEQKQQNFVKAIDRCKEKLKSLHSQLQKSLEEFKAAQDAAAEKDPNADSDFAGLIISHQHKVRQESILQLAELSALAVDIIMRVCEAFNDSAPSESEVKLSVTEKATYISEICDFFSEEISGLSAAQVDAVRQLVTQLKAIPNISKQAVQAAEKESSAIYMDSGSAITHINEAKKFTIQLCKFLLIHGESSSTSS